MVRIDFNRLRFLVIDDNAHMRRILRTLLHGFGTREVFLKAENSFRRDYADPLPQVCTRVIAARRPIPVHSGEPCWIFGRSSLQFWRGTA
jgi:hypothetical protein